MIGEKVLFHPGTSEIWPAEVVAYDPDTEIADLLVQPPKRWHDRADLIAPEDGWGEIEQLGCRHGFTANCWRRDGERNIG